MATHWRRAAIAGGDSLPVGGIFKSGMYEYDSSFCFISVPAAQEYLEMEGRATGIEVKIEDMFRASEQADEIEFGVVDRALGCAPTHFVYLAIEDHVRRVAGKRRRGRLKRDRGIPDDEDW